MFALRARRPEIINCQALVPIPVPLARPNPFPKTKANPETIGSIENGADNKILQA